MAAAALVAPLGDGGISLDVDGAPVSGERGGGQVGLIAPGRSQMAAEHHDGYGAGAGAAQGHRRGLDTGAGRPGVVEEQDPRPVQLRGGEPAGIQVTGVAVTARSRGEISPGEPQIGLGQRPERM
jgi:hypothetical protein